MKKVFIIIGTILCLFCVALDVWCVVVYTFAKQKEVSNTIEVDILETSNGKERQPFIELNYYSNKNKNGLELFEVKYNFFMDENQTKIVSLGSQYVANSVNDTLTWGSSMRGYHITKDEHYGFLNMGHRIVYDVFFDKYLTGNNSYYEYQSSNDYQTVIGNQVNSITKTSRFKVTVGDQMVQMGLKFDTADEDFYLGTVEMTSLATEDINHRYQYIDQHLFAHDLLESVRDASLGSNVYEIAKFSNYFDYYLYDGKTYNKIENTQNSKIRTDFESYFVIKVNKYEDGARLATDSIFNVIKGDATFNLDGEYKQEGYYYGRSVINVELSAFDLKQVDENKYILVLKDTFIESYKPYTESIVLYIDINIETNFEIVGFGDSLKDFKIYKCTVNGEPLTKVVDSV